MIGVISSPFADELCAKNNLTFVELLQPFSKLTNDGNFIYNVSYQLIWMRRVKSRNCLFYMNKLQHIFGMEIKCQHRLGGSGLIFVMWIGDRHKRCSLVRCLPTQWRAHNVNAPLQFVLMVYFSHHLIIYTKISNLIIIKGDLIFYHFTAQTTIDVPSSELWFEQWREIFLSIQTQSDHEFTRHFLSCLIVLSSSDPNSLDTAHLLTRRVQAMQNVTPPKIPKWFTSDALNCYVLLHDLSQQGDIT